MRRLPSEPMETIMATTLTMTDKTALVTGGTTGIGYAIAAALVVGGPTSSSLARMPAGLRRR